MSNRADPQAPQESTPEKNAGTDSSAPSPETKRDEPFVWPRDLNAPPAADPTWGADPEVLRHD